LKIVIFLTPLAFDAVITGVHIGTFQHLLWNN